MTADSAVGTLAGAEAKFAAQADGQRKPQVAAPPRQIVKRRARAEQRPKKDRDARRGNAQARAADKAEIQCAGSRVMATDPEAGRSNQDSRSYPPSKAPSATSAE